MKKNIYWIRHAESLSNTSELNSQIEDPKITQKGIEECKQLREKIFSDGLDKRVDLIVVSPLTRTLQTCHELFYDLIYHIPIISLDEIREQIDKPCHKRINISEKKKIYPYVKFQIDSNNDLMYKKVSGNESFEQVLSRCEWFVEWLRHRKEKNIVVVTHGNFLYPMFNNILTNVSNKTFFSNCEMRLQKIN